MMAWAELAESLIDGANLKDGPEDLGSDRRGDVAVDVMAIVGSVL